VSGQLDPVDERAIFHNVKVTGPGTVTFSFSVKATDAKAGAKFAVLTEKNTEALGAADVQPGESVYGTYSIQVSDPITVIR
jgi:hypothetical protein